MRKVLLINPARIYYKKSLRTSPQGMIGLPLGILYVAAALEKNGCRVKIIDSLVHEHSIIKEFANYTYYGVPSELLKKDILDFNPDIVGIASQSATQEENVFETAKLIKDIRKSIPVIVGGANAVPRAGVFLEDRNIDIVIRGEGEATIGEVVEYYRNRKNLGEIPGITYRLGDEIIATAGRPFIENSDTLPFPAYHLVDMERYLTLYKKGIYVRGAGVRRNISVVTSRGCPYSCTFCSIAQSMGRLWRAHSPPYLIKHIELLSKTYGVKHIHFEDDNLFFDPKRFSGILGTLAQEKITWDTPNGIRADLSITEEMLREFRKTGCQSIAIGVESGDEHILNTVIKKSLKLADVEEFARRCKKAKVFLRAFFVLGFPGETVATMQKTMDFALHLARVYSVEILNFIATPLYGTELYEICEKGRYFSTDISPEALSESINPEGYGLITTESFSSYDVERMSKIFTSLAYRDVLRKAVRHPIRYAKRVGNLYNCKKVINSLLPKIS